MPTQTPEKKILIVEDEQLIAHSIERSLFKAGYSVPAMATSAQEAYEQIEQTRPDLVLMDIHIQGPSDGIETARTIRERYHLPVIYLTAHADADTLERAKITEPLGYLVKPVNHANLPSSIEMALYKHKMDRQLEEHRALLSTILESIAEAVLVTDGAGYVQFLNPAAETLTGWSQSDALGKPFDEIAALESDAAASLLLRALTGHKTILVPRDTTLQTRHGVSIFVDGQIAISKSKGRAAGAMVTLHDASFRREEERRIIQEQRMVSVGQMANDIANDFYGLFDLIASFSEQLTHGDDDEEFVTDIAGYISRASSAGVALARQLVDLGSSQGSRPELINLNEILAERQPLYNHLCGPSICVENRLKGDLDLVLNHALHLEKLALNLILSAKHSMPNGGKIIISTSNITGPGERGTADKQFVRFVVESHRNAPSTDTAPAPPSKAQNTALTLTVVNAIVAVSEGCITTSEESELLTATEVLLPSAASVKAAGAETSFPARRTVLTVGLDADRGHRLNSILEENGFTVLQSANAQEASLVSSFVDQTVDLLIIDSATVNVSAQRRVFGVLSSRWPEAKTLVIAAGEEQAGLPSATVLASPYDPKHLVEVADALTRDLPNLAAHLSSDAAADSSVKKRSRAVPR